MTTNQNKPRQEASEPMIPKDLEDIQRLYGAYLELAELASLSDKGKLETQPQYSWNSPLTIVICDSTN